MFRWIAARGVAVLFVAFPFLFGGATTGFAGDLAYVGPVEAIEPPSHAAAVAEPFGLRAEPVAYGEVLNKWSGVVANIGAEREILARCRADAADCPPAALKFLTVIADGRSHDGKARIGTINRAINMAIRPTSDLAQWGVPDRWSSPLATFATGRGDCEDYAIAKYVALREAGVAETDLRLVIVHDFANGEDHAVVTARVDEKWIVLDNRRLTLVEDIDMPRVQPLFVFDRDGVKRFAPAIAEAHRAPATIDNTAAPSSLGL